VSHALREARPDLVHLQYQTAAYGMSPVVNFLPLLLRCQGVRAPFVTTFHDVRPPYLFPKAGRLRGLAVRALAALSDAAIFTHPGDLAWARATRAAAWIPIGANVVPGGVTDGPAERARLGIRPDQIVVAHFGFLNASKGVDVLLRAIHRLVRGQLDVRLLLIGDEVGASDPSNEEVARQVRRLAVSLGIEERIIRTGPLPARDVSRALAAADVAALPFADGASLRRGSLLACLAHGLPVVTTSGAPEPPVPASCRVAPFESLDPRLTSAVVALVPPGDDTALAREIFGLVEDPPRREALSQAGREIARQLSWPSIARATANIYQRVLVGHFS
jgi:glycosyltransferase involved in cell wall biosynthesis